MAKLDECDVALVDLGLPDGTGTDVLRAIRTGSKPVRAAIYSGKEDADEIVGASGEQPEANVQEAGRLRRDARVGVPTRH